MKDPYTNNQFKIPDEVQITPVPSSTVKIGSFLFKSAQDYLQFLRSRANYNQLRSFYPTFFTKGKLVKDTAETYAGSNAYYSLVEEDHTLWQGNIMYCIV